MGWGGGRGSLPGVFGWKLWRMEEGVSSSFSPSEEESSSSDSSSSSASSSDVDSPLSCSLSARRPYSGSQWLGRHLGGGARAEGDERWWGFSSW